MLDPRQPERTGSAQADARTLDPIHAAAMEAAYRAELEASDDPLIRVRVRYMTDDELDRLARNGAVWRARVAAGEFGAVDPRRPVAQERAE